MSLWVLDTDHVSLFQQGDPIVSERINKINPNELAVTIITAEEQLRGRLNMIRRATSANEMISTYARLGATLNYFSSINLLNSDSNVYNFYTDFRNQKIRIGSQDLKIAAIVLSVNGILVTRNQRDFSQVPGLRFEDWTIR